MPNLAEMGEADRDSEITSRQVAALRLMPNVARYNKNHVVDPVLDGYEPKVALNIFDQVRRVARPSHEETPAMALLVSLADTYGFPCFTDDVGNLCVHVPGTAGFENHEPIGLHGHIDMVCNAANDAEYDPRTDGVEKLQVSDDGYLQAQKTTLGMDNLGGVGAFFAAAIDPNRVSPPLRIIVTRGEEEEGGMYGAEGLDLKKLGVDGVSRLVNGDTEENGEICIASAGALAFRANRPLTRDQKDQQGEGSYIKISISGMPQGHSGVTVHEERGNAIISMAKLLGSLPSGVRMVSLNGGKGMTVIPANAEAVLFIPNGLDIDAIKTQATTFVPELGEKWPPAKVEVNDVSAEEVTIGVISEGIHRQILTTLTTVADGVHKISEPLGGVVPETSSNLGTATTTDENFTVGVAVRSFIDAERDAHTERAQTVFRSAGFGLQQVVKVDAWYQDAHASVVNAARDACEEATGKTSKDVGVHGGLELAEIDKKVKAALMAMGRDPDEAQSVSIGFKINEAHGPTEGTLLRDYENFYKQLLITLKNLAVKYPKMAA